MHFVSLRAFKPLTPGTRWKREFVAVKTYKSPTAKHNLVVSWKAGRNKQGTKILRTHSKLYSKKKLITPAILLKTNDIFVATKFFFNFYNEKPFVYFKTKRKSSFFLPATTTNQPGLLVYAFIHARIKKRKMFPGIPVYLYTIKYYLAICFLSTKPYKKYKYATSSGVYCIKLRAPKKEKLLKIILPSKQIKFFSPATLCVLGKVKQMWRKKRTIGKAGVLKNKGKNSIVRGIAMNSVDHPHGGKANSCAPERSPWGWIAKKNK